jgi:bacterioferritin-associated ferredoxin
MNSLASRNPAMELSQTARVVDRHTNHARALCHCLNVTEPEVRDAIETNDLVTVRGVAQACGAGGGCTACHRHLKRLLNEHVVAKRMQQPLMSYGNDAS